MNSYLGGGFDIESLVETLLKQLAGNAEILVNVYDVTNASMPLIMYGPEQMVGYTGLSHVSMLEFGDPFRRHQMECRQDFVYFLLFSMIFLWACAWLI